MNAKVAGVLGILIAIIAFLCIVTPETFLSGQNIENLLKRTAMFGILGIGVAFVIITSGIDLSIGSVVCLIGCLLAIFLSVDYQPFDVQSVLEVHAKDRQIVLAGSAKFAPGDQIRYYGGRRARNALLTIVDVDQLDGNTILTCDDQLSRDDSLGKVGRVYALRNHGESSVELTPALPEIGSRDQLWLVNANSQLKQLTVKESVVEQDATRLELESSPGELSGEWFAVPLQRRQRMPVPLALLSVVGIALLLGLLHGVLVTKQNLPPFVVTLCGLLFYRGISRWLVSDQTMGFGSEYARLSHFGTGKFPLVTADGKVVFGIPYPFFVLLLIAIVAAVFLNKTIWGRYMLALGRNEEAARYSGINTDRATIGAYVISTVLAAVGGILFALDSNSIAPSSFGNFFELYAIAAAVLGGCSLRGGQGGILGVVIGTALMQVLYNLIVLLKISDKLEFAIIGAVILIGVMADESIRRFAERRRSLRKT